MSSSGLGSSSLRHTPCPPVSPRPPARPRITARASTSAPPARESPALCDSYLHPNDPTLLVSCLHLSLPAPLARQAAAAAERGSTAPSAKGPASPPPGEAAAAITAKGGAPPPSLAPPPTPTPAGAGVSAGSCAAKPPPQVRLRPPAHPSPLPPPSSYSPPLARHPRSRPARPHPVMVALTFHPLSGDDPSRALGRPPALPARAPPPAAGASAPPAAAVPLPAAAAAAAAAAAEGLGWDRPGRGRKALGRMVGGARRRAHGGECPVGERLQRIQICLVEPAWLDPPVQPSQLGQSGGQSAPSDTSCLPLRMRSARRTRILANDLLHPLSLSRGEHRLGRAARAVAVCPIMTKHSSHSPPLPRAVVAVC
jgi:hypothetical protein